MRPKHSIFISMIYVALAIHSSSSTAADADSVAGYPSRAQIADFHAGDRDGTGGHPALADIDGLNRTSVFLGDPFMGDIEGLSGKPRIMPGDQDGVVGWARAAWKWAWFQCSWRH